MRERPILFSAPMIRAILAGTKTQTRRIVKPQPERVLEHVVDIGRDVGRVIPATIPDGWQWRSLYCADDHDFPGSLALHCPYGMRGDRLWVKETHVYRDKYEQVYYRADHPDHDPYCHNGWRPSIFMPRKWSRITLEITGVRVERLHEIDELAALAEGVEGRSVESVLDGKRGEYVIGSARDEFTELWRTINGAASWDANPWVWVVSFQRVAQAATTEAA